MAINASINFLLYCCFSARFRSTFQSHFTFLSKHCARYIEPKWKANDNIDRTRYSTSVDNMSGYSLHGNQIHTRASNISIDMNSKYLTGINQKYRAREQSCCRGLSKFIKPTSNINRTLKLIKEESVRKSPSNNQSLSLYALNRPAPKSRFYSYRSIPESHHHREAIWIQRPQSFEQFLNRPEILDVAV